MLSREAIEARATESVLAFYDEAKRRRQFSESLLVSFDRSESRNQIAFAVRSATRIEFSVDDGRGEWTDGPVSQMPDWLDVIMAVDKKGVWTGTAFTVNDRIAASHFEAASADADTLHHLLDRFGCCAHASPARGNGWHATKSL